MKLIQSHESWQYALKLGLGLIQSQKFCEETLFEVS